MVKLKIFKLCALGLACTIFYITLGLGVLVADVQPRWFLVPAGVICLLAIPITWWQVWKWIQLVRNQE
jgi:hypothetical protein